MAEDRSQGACALFTRCRRNDDLGLKSVSWEKVQADIPAPRGAQPHAGPAAGLGASVPRRPASPGRVR